MFLRGDDMKKLMVMLAIVSLVVISGCYRPNWYRANTTYAELKTDSEWCKGQTNIGATRAEMIQQYEGCMEGKGYQLKGKDPSSGGEPIRVEQKEGPPIAIDRGAKVYVFFNASPSGGTGVALGMSVYRRYFHKKDCKHLSNVSVKEMTAGEAIAQGLSMCPDCFRD